MISVSPVSDVSTEEQKARSLEFLAVLRRQQETARLSRIHYMRLARQYGATNFEIGSELGVSEAAVRAMLKRAGSDDV